MYYGDHHGASGVFPVYPISDLLLAGGCGDRDHVFPHAVKEYLQEGGGEYQVFKCHGRNPEECFPHEEPEPG